MTTDPTLAVIEDAVGEARRRAILSERDLAPAVGHFAASLAAVCADWDLTARGWFDGGAGMPTLDVVREDGTPGVLKVAEPGDLDAAARVMVAAGGRGYARVLAWNPAAGALLTERLGVDLWSEQAGLVEVERVWRWGFVERVTTGLYLAWHGYADEAVTFLDTAGEVARQA